MSSIWSRINRLTIAVITSIAWMGLIFGLSSRSTLPIPKDWSAHLTSIAGHFSVYLVLAILLYWTLSFVMAPGLPRYGSAWGLAVLYGFSDEWHQSFVPGRTPDPVDILTDATGAAVGLLLVWWVSNRLVTPSQPNQSRESRMS